MHINISGNFVRYFNNIELGIKGKRICSISRWNQIKMFWIGFAQSYKGFVLFTLELNIMKNLFYIRIHQIFNGINIIIPINQSIFHQS